MDDDEHDDQNTIPPDIMRVMQNLNQTWRRCRRKSCKRGRSCRNADVSCATEREPPVPHNNEKLTRDNARAMAIFQRMLRERLDQASTPAPTVAPQPRKRSRRDVD